MSHAETRRTQRGRGHPQIAQITQIVWCVVKRPAQEISSISQATIHAAAGLVTRTTPFRELTLRELRWRGFLHRTANH